MTSPRRLDEVTIFNNGLTFLIPHEWVEVESGADGTYGYQMPDTQSGWFRASLITTKGVAKPAERLTQIFERRGGVVYEVATGNLVRQSEKDTVQDGENLHIYFWFVGACVAPDMVCEAVFSYTVLSSLVSDAETLSEVKLIDRLVRDARFNTTNVRDRHNDPSS